MKGLTQLQAAQKSGIGVKTISSFETGQRIDGLKLSQLKRLLAVYGVCEEDFFGGATECMINGSIPFTTESDVMRAVHAIVKFPPDFQRALAQRINDMCAAVECAR